MGAKVVIKFKGQTISCDYLCNHLSKYLTFICTLCVISSDPISVYATFSTLQIFSIQLASNIQCSGVFTNFKWNIVIVSKKSKSFRMLTKEMEVQGWGIFFLKAFTKLEHVNKHMTKDRQTRTLTRKRHNTPKG